MSVRNTQRGAYHDFASAHWRAQSDSSDDGQISCEWVTPPCHRGQKRTAKPVAPKRQFRLSVQAHPDRQPSCHKNTASVFQKNVIVFAHPASTRGAYRDRHGRRVRDAMDVRLFSALWRRRRHPRVRRRRVVLVPRRWDQVSRGTFRGKRRWLSSPDTGESAYKSSNHCAGSAGLFRRTCGD
jgi:hypothetical protein